MTPPNPIVFLVDVDNTLLDNDRVEDDLKRHFEDGGDCEEVLASFARAGIDVDALAAQLQDEGATSFVQSWNELLAVIASKSAALRRPARGARR